MALIYFSIEKGANQSGVVIANASAETKTFELSIDLGDTPSRVQVINGLEHIKNVILRSEWPPNIP